jgi:hypothetical protein
MCVPCSELDLDKSGDVSRLSAVASRIKCVLNIFERLLLVLVILMVCIDMRKKQTGT